jgi:hypothetical protein
MKAAKAKQADTRIDRDMETSPFWRLWLLSRKPLSVIARLDRAIQ